jgi:hypothetical protein
VQAEPTSDSGRREVHGGEALLACEWACEPPEVEQGYHAGAESSQPANPGRFTGGRCCGLVRGVPASALGEDSNSDPRTRRPAHAV